MYYKKKKETNPNSTKYKFKKTSSALSFLSVAAVTFSNGGDNIGIYTPLFASNNIIGQIDILVVLFLIMTAVWCSIGYYLVNQFSCRPFATYWSFNFTFCINSTWNLYND